jgi:hypothetical protein
MRIVGTLEREHCKITIFQSDTRLLLKIENARYEQTFKIPQSDLVQSPQDIDRLLDEEFMGAVMSVFGTMHRTMGKAIEKLESEKHGEFDFEKII